MTNVPAPPTLSNPVHYGGTGQPYPTNDSFTIDGRGGDILMENPADGQPLKNKAITIKDFRRVYIRGLHLKYDDRLFTVPRGDNLATEAAAASIGSDALEKDGPGGVPENYMHQVFNNTAWRGHPDWPNPNTNTYRLERRAIKVAAHSGNEELFYVEGMFFEDANQVFHQGDVFALQNNGGSAYAFYLINSRIDGAGVPGEDDRDARFSQGRIYRTVHADIVQTQGGKVGEFQFWNSEMYGDYQNLFIPVDQNGGAVYDFYMGRVRIGSRPGETIASVIFMRDNDPPPPIKHWDDVWVQRDWSPGNGLGNEAWRILRPYSENWFSSVPEPPWDQNVGVAQAGNKILRMRKTNSPDLPDFAPADKVGANYVSPW